MGKIIDLHIHTNLSDGLLSPKEIVDEAFKNGAYVIAIADHDTVAAYDDELYNYAKSKNIKIINAVEISTKTDKSGIHVLGYNFDINNRGLKEKLHLLKNARHDYLHNVSHKLKQLGYKLDVNKLDEIDVVTKAHIANDIINNQDNYEILIKHFNHIPKKGEFIETIMNEGCPAYVKKETITPKEAAQLIKKAGGKAILAHPIAYKYEDNYSDNEIIELIKEMDADGIEAVYVYVDNNDNKINEISKWSKVAKDNNLFITIGSDFHKKDGIHPEVGLIGENLNLNDDIVSSIIDNLLK